MHRQLITITSPISSYRNKKEKDDFVTKIDFMIVLKNSDTDFV